MPFPASLRRALCRTAAVLLVATGFGVVALNGPGSVAAGGAISTTTNVGAGTGACVHPGLTVSDPDPTNCNTYAAKEDVWLSNLPQALPDGTYYFAVLVPGGQTDPNDGSPQLLSTDAHTNREFTVSGGVVSTSGTHAVVGNKVQLADFGDTTNGGGVYVAAVCSADSYPAAGGDCKYDAFKVGPSTTTEIPGPTILKDADGSYDTTYAWEIGKAADKTTVHQVSGNVVFNYTVTASHDAGTVSDVQVTGTITVFNPNTDEVTADVTDTLSDGTTCSVTGGSGATLAAGDNTFPYSCDLTGLPQGELDNTATVTWGQQSVDGGTLAAGSADFTFTDISFTGTSTDECVDVTDTFTGSLGSACVGDANPKEFTYSRSIAVQPGCVDHDNTATFTTNDTGAQDSASKTVTVCGPLDTGALTIGFWSNKNGQGLIGSTTAANCAVGGFLRTYAPFQDLALGASCKAVSTYVANVIAAANAKGASMNAMLKAQMLATALDVWFTGPGSTATSLKFLPNSNLGGITIDLTSICKNPGACSVLEDVSSAFGGATSLTVSQMLNHAASQSSSGGSSWYGQVKATQELAKDAFDAINNEVAFGP
jgi:hypothetical protein